MINASNENSTSNSSKFKNTLSKYKKDFTLQFKAFINSLLLSGKTLLKWIICGLIIGAVVGTIGAGFHHILDLVTHTREANSWLLFLLPVSGLVIVFMYRLIGDNSKKGTNLVISAIQKGERIPLRMTPLIIISTALTHLFGGSAGREGAALQIGGSLGNFFAKLARYDSKDTKTAIMCGMSACFSALFGTPVAATIFSMEVINIGSMHIAAMVPCIISSMTAYLIARMTGLEGTHFTVSEVPTFNAITGSKFFLMAVIFACASILLCFCLHKSSDILKHLFKNEYIRIVVAALCIIALRYLLGTTDYLGAGTAVIAKSFTESCLWYIFLLKMLFTGITLGGGFKGGEIVPTLFVGATLGSFLAPIFGLPVGICAACGMVSVFCGVTNCPIASTIIAIEMFGGESMMFCVLCIAVSFLLSGYFSLYSTQTATFSKYKEEYINDTSL